MGDEWGRSVQRSSPTVKPFQSAGSIRQPAMANVRGMPSRAATQNLHISFTLRSLFSVRMEHGNEYSFGWLGEGVRMAKKILVVDDDRKIVELIQLYLEKDGYRVLVAHDGLEALEKARQARPDLIVLDLLLPGMDGLDVCRILQAEAETPIIMLTAKTTEGDKLVGLELGADDYITKPFSPRELLARVRAVLRRVAKEAAQATEELHFGRLIIDRRGHEVRLDGEVIPLTPTEFQLLAEMAREPGRAFTRLELLDQVFGYDFVGFERTVDVHVKNLRKKIETDPKQPCYIQTVYGVGYKFCPD